MSFEHGLILIGFELVSNLVSHFILKGLKFVILLSIIRYQLVYF